MTKYMLKQLLLALSGWLKDCIDPDSDETIVKAVLAIDDIVESLK